MAISGFDSEQLISRFCRALAPADRGAFQAAAESALAGCDGEGLAFRLLRPIFQAHFHPPADTETRQPLGVGSRRPSKLAAGPPVGRDDPRTGGRDRHRMAV
jgi:hypothetical protein